MPPRSKGSERIGFSIYSDLFGCYAGARLLKILSRSADVGAPLKSLPNSPSTPELNLKMAEGEPFALIDKLKAAGRFTGATERITIDGLGVEYSDGFGLARPSNTTPVVILRFEADNDAAQGYSSACVPHARIDNRYTSGYAPYICCVH